MSADQQKTLKALEECSASSENGYANFFIRTVDLNTEKDEDTLKVWSKHSSVALPAIVLHYPMQAPDAPSAWSGPLTVENVQRIVSSPARTELVKRLQAGEASIWVLVECGSAEQNTAAAEMLSKVLPQQKRTVTLDPPDDPYATEQPDPEKPKPAGKELTIAFSLQRVAANDPADSVFVQMLRGVQEPAANMPVVYPVFGQGRALCGLTGEDLVVEALEGVCRFVAGPCSCQVNDQNPGRDLLLWAKWAKGTEQVTDGQPKLPPLVGLTHLTGVANSPKVVTAAPVVVTPAEPPATSSLTRNLAWAAGGIVLLVVLGALVLMSRARKE